MKDKINTILWIGISYVLPILIAIGFAVFTLSYSLNMETHLPKKHLIGCVG